MVKGWGPWVTAGNTLACMFEGFHGCDVACAVVSRVSLHIVGLRTLAGQVDHPPSLWVLVEATGSGGYSDLAVSQYLPLEECPGYWVRVDPLMETP